MAKLNPFYCVAGAIALFTAIAWIGNSELQPYMPWAKPPYPVRIQHGFREPDDGTFDPEITLKIKRRLEELGFVADASDRSTQGTPKSDFKWRLVRTHNQVLTNVNLSWRHQMNWIEGESHITLKGKHGAKLLSEESLMLQEQITKIVDDLTDGGKLRRLHAGLEVEN